MKIKLFAFSCLFIINCSISPLAPNPVAVEQPLINGVVSRNPLTNFNNDLKAAGIVLSRNEIDLIRLYTGTKPNGQWAAAGTSDARANLASNFNNFKATFQPNGPRDEFEYLDQALSFANSANLYARYYFDVSYYQKRQKILVVKWDIQTKEFILIHTDGRISNYQLANAIVPPRYIAIPEIL